MLPDPPVSPHLGLRLPFWRADCGCNVALAYTLLKNSKQFSDNSVPTEVSVFRGIGFSLVLYLNWNWEPSENLSC
jgi:hypothetical protein